MEKLGLGYIFTASRDKTVRQFNIEIRHEVYHYKSIFAMALTPY